MNARFERDFAEQFDPMAEVAKPVNQAELKTLNDMNRGKRDCMNGVPHKAGQSKAYDVGYGDQYEREQRDD